MPGKSVFCIASSRIQANRIVDHLANAGFSPSDVSVIFPDRNPPAPIGDYRSGVATVGLGLALGGVLEWLSGAGAFSAPGAGSLIACGPIGGILKRHASRSPARDVKTVLVDMGISRNDAKLYQDSVKDGQVLVCLHADDWREADAARKIFQAVGATNISILGEKASSHFSTVLTDRIERQTTLAGAPA